MILYGSFLKEISDVLKEETKAEGGESRISPDIENAGQEGSYIINQEDTIHPEEDGHSRMAQGWHKQAKSSYITVNLIR